MSLDEQDSSNESTEHKKNQLLTGSADNYEILDGKHTPQNIALYGFLFGFVTGGSIAIAYYSETIPQLGIFFATLSIFHILEYIITAMFNPDRLSLDSFLVNNGRPYHIAHIAGVLEYSIELLLFPNLKSIRLFHYTGLALILIGQTARTLAMYHAKSNFTHRIQYVRRQEHTLVTTGIYHYLRHPSYFGFYWWAVGTQILLCNPICFLGFLSALHHFFKSRIEEEEPLLIKFFGNDYIEYRKRSPVLIPFIK